MKASTLFALTVAALLGLGAAVTAKLMGFFEASPPPVREAPPKILVAGINIFEGMAISQEMLFVRNMTADEQRRFEGANKDQLLPATLGAAILRIPIRNIEADTPILKTDLEDLAFPEGMPSRLQPGMRAVNVDVPQIRAAGGLIARRQFVDVLLTTSICDGSNCKSPATQTAMIAHNLRVIAKRNI